MKKIFPILACALFLSPLPVFSENELLAPGDFFPAYAFTGGLSDADASYLGLGSRPDPEAGFTAADIGGDLIVLELFNTYCFGCRQQAPLIAEVYRMVAGDKALSSRVRILGVGVGNNARAVENFRKEFQTPFPLVPDMSFGIMDAIGAPGGTPFSYFLRRTPGGLLVVGSHFGVMDSPSSFTAEIKTALTGDADALVAAADPSEVPEWVLEDLKPPLSGEALENRVLAGMERAGYSEVKLSVVKLASGGEVYIGDGPKGRVFSRVISRLPVCDVCHPVHFIITFDREGKVADFDALYVTKYWNRDWTPEEVESMRKKLVGLSILEERVFDPDVDAVSTATISSSLIFDSVGRLDRVLKVLEESGYL